jgi:AcrR family transcriptional regulator
MTLSSTAGKQHITRTAADLFQQQGFRRTTCPQIASAAGVSIEQFTGQFESKEAIALALYQEISAETLAYAQSLEPAKLGEMVDAVLQDKLQRMAQYRGSMSALFAEAMQEEGCIQNADISPGRQDATFQALAYLVDTASDTPDSPDDTENLTLLLYSFHFLVLLFWLYDRTENRRATAMLLTFLRDMLGMLRPLLMMPLSRNVMIKLSHITLLVFGGAKIVSDSA